VAKQLILDANILMRAVLGTRVARLIRDYAAAVDLLTVDEAFDDVAIYLPEVLAKRGGAEAEILAAITKLESLRPFIQTIPTTLFEPLEFQARERLKGRDEDDWPYLALALVLDCPIWTEDTDFFGCGIPIWTTDRIEFYLRD
jgi:predicted nucleic acid-binding protein